MSKEADKVRDRLSLDGLDPKDRQDLFKQFTKAGGQVVSEKKEVKLSNISRSQTEKASVGKHNVKAAALSSNPFDVKAEDVLKGIKTKVGIVELDELKKTPGYMVFFKKVSCVFAGVFNLSATKFSPNFKIMTLDKVYSEYIVLKLFLDPIFQKTTPESVRFREYMCEQNLILEYEIAYHAYYLFDLQNFKRLQETRNITVDNSEADFKYFFSRLTLYYHYIAQMKVAIGIVIKQFGILFPNQKNKLHSPARVDLIFNTIWSTWYYSLEELIQYYLGRHNNHHAPQGLLAFLGIEGQSAKIGHLAEEWKAQYNATLKKEKEAKEAATHSKENGDGSTFPSESIERGINYILTNVDFANYFKTFKGRKDLRALFTEEDQVFYTYALVDYFDKEFSFLWGGDLIPMHVIPDDVLGRFDAKKELKLIHNKINQFYELVNEYLRNLRSVHAAVDGQKRQDHYGAQLSKDLSRSSYTARQHLLHAYTEYLDIFNKIVATRDKGDSIVENWEEELGQNKVHSHRVLFEKTVEDAINHTADYLGATCWLLRYSELSGLSGKLMDVTILPKDLVEQALIDI